MPKVRDWAQVQTNALFMFLGMTEEVFEEIEAKAATEEVLSREYRGNSIKNFIRAKNKRKFLQAL